MKLEMRLNYFGFPRNFKNKLCESPAQKIQFINTQKRVIGHCRTVFCQIVGETSHLHEILWGTYVIVRLPAL
jgi:hypothetical protein